jgi:hypothetical protein
MRRRFVGGLAATLVSGKISRSSPVDQERKQPLTGAKSVPPAEQVIYGGGINALVKHGGVAALKDTAHEARIRQLTRENREQTLAQLKEMGFELIPSDANFFMVNIRRDVTPVGEEFRKRGILVGRKFPPWTSGCACRSAPRKTCGDSWPRSKRSFRDGPTDPVGNR